MPTITQWTLALPRASLQALLVWPAPELTDETLAAYREGQSDGTGYSLADHPQLASGAPRRLFEALRRELIALDASVREEVLKLYVAFKAETNFADVIPQSQSLLIVLNMRFSDLVDPRGRCRDVSGVGRWGNGEVEVRVDRLEDVPYVVGLARQALELQIGGGEEQPTEFVA